MQEFIMLVGIPGSGKSTYAKELKNEKGYELISSDAIRNEFNIKAGCDEGNKIVFEILHYRVVKALKEGKSIIYDATNINSKRRRGFILSYLNKFKDIKKKCVYFSVNIYNCIRRDKQRGLNGGFTVGKEVIKKMYRNLQIPMYHEGWDIIDIEQIDEYSKITSLDIDKINNYNDYIYWILSEEINLNGCVNMGQDNPYHNLSVCRHMFYAYNHIKNYTSNKNILLASLLHDIGKPYCKNYKDGSKYANFIGHENVSAQLAVGILNSNNFHVLNTIEIATYIQLHMRLMGAEYKSKERLRRLIGKDLFDGLCLLYQGDTVAK